MLNGQKIVVVMPAYNAARTLRQTYDEVMAHGIVDLVIVVDDASHDETVAIARTLPHVQVEVHPENRGYGANQKTCYRLALAASADIIIMIHPDYQYTPQLIPAMAALVASGLYPCVLASRILGGGALRGGMPWWKYISNRGLTLVENLLIGAKLSGISHWLSRIFAPIAGAAAPGGKLQRLCVRQPSPRASHCSRLRDRRSHVSSQIHARGVINQFSQKRALRPRLHGNRSAFPAGAVGSYAANRLSIGCYEILLDQYHRIT